MLNVVRGFTGPSGTFLRKQSPGLHPFLNGLVLVYSDVGVSHVS